LIKYIEITFSALIGSKDVILNPVAHIDQFILTSVSSSSDESSPGFIEVISKVNEPSYGSGPATAPISP
jgi:hypothetical protein